MLERLKKTVIYQIVNPFFQYFSYALWLMRSKDDCAPHIYKQRLVKELQYKYGVDTFVETGTYLGNMINSVKSNFSQIFSIEVERGLYQFNKRKFRRYKHIHLVFGDSSKKIKSVLKKVNRPAIFWLDAHFSSGLTGGRGLKPPVLSELKAILTHRIKNHIILIDDARLFVGKNGYPSLQDIKSLLLNDNIYKMEIKAGIIRLIPKSTRNFDQNNIPKGIYFFVGTTAELIKISPLVRKLEDRNIDFKIISSNQNVLHFNDLSFIISRHDADYTFRMRRYSWLKNIYLAFIVWIFRSVLNFYIYFKRESKQCKKNFCLIIQGDTVTALVGAVVAKLCRMKLLHIEAGLRSFSFIEPFPEELSRYVISKLADVHFCPNNWSASNLEGTKGTKIVTGHNTLVESTFSALKCGENSVFLEKMKGKKFFILVLHRQEHMLFARKFTETAIKILVDFAEKSGFYCVFIMHKITRDFLEKNGMYGVLTKSPWVILAPRLSYSTFVKLLSKSQFIATDGGSNQEEAYYLGKPCLILRNRTERIEGLGENAVLSGRNEFIIKSFLAQYEQFRRRKVKLETLPSEVIVNYLVT